MEPSYLLTNVLVFALPFGCYFFGIVVRKVAMPSASSAPWSHQLLLGVPVSMVVVGPLMPVLSRTLTDVPALLVTLGVIMEHGMVVNEAAANIIKNGVGKNTTGAAATPHEDPDDPKPRGT